MTRALEPVWDALQAALDARRDPLDDPRVAEFLAERPDAAREYAELVLALERVGRAEHGERRELVGGLHRGERRARAGRRGRRALAIAAAAVLLVVLGAVALRVASRAPHDPARVVDAPRPPERVHDARAAEPGVEHYRIESVRVTPRSRELVVVEDGRVARRTTTAESTDALAATIEHTTWAARGRELR